MEPLRKPALICLPFAGGSSFAYSTWAKLLGPHCDVVAVEYPGRGRLANRPCLTRVPDLLDEIIAQLEEVLLTRDYFLFGHSLGALLCYELSQRLADIGYPEPQGVYVSAANPPHRLILRQRHKQSDDDFLDHLKGLGGIPHELLEQSDVRAFIANVLRSDFTALENFGWTVKNKLSCPLHVISAPQDPMVEKHLLPEWQACTEAAPHFFTVSKGGHMFLEGARAEIIEYLQSTMTAQNDI